MKNTKCPEAIAKVKSLAAIYRKCGARVHAGKVKTFLRETPDPVALERASGIAAVLAKSGHDVDVCAEQGRVSVWLDSGHFDLDFGVYADVVDFDVSQQDLCYGDEGGDDDAPEMDEDHIACIEEDRAFDKWLDEQKVDGVPYAKALDIAHEWAISVVKYAWDK